MTLFTLNVLWTDPSDNSAILFATLPSMNCHIDVTFVKKQNGNHAPLTLPSDDNILKEYESQTNVQMRLCLLSASFRDSCQNQTKPKMQYYIVYICSTC